MGKGFIRTMAVVQGRAATPKLLKQRACSEAVVYRDWPAYEKTVIRSRVIGRDWHGVRIWLRPVEFDASGATGNSGAARHKRSCAITGSQKLIHANRALARFVFSGGDQSDVNLRLALADAALRSLHEDRCRRNPVGNPPFPPFDWMWTIQYAGPKVSTRLRWQPGQRSHGLPQIHRAVPATGGQDR